MENNNKIRMGIGFATGRKNFQSVLRTYAYNWKECGLINNDNISLNLIVAYDLKYYNTQIDDYINISDDLLTMIDNTYFIGDLEIEDEINNLISNDILNEDDAKLLFGRGYAAKRNAVLYMAIKNNIDYLLFLDDDEYPVAVTKTRSTAVWGGQSILMTHLNNIVDADITNGYHCGYISPIPYLEFNNILKEQDFKLFIEAISNDIINWDSICSVMSNGGVTYADTKILMSDEPEEVVEVNHAKFISGSNLCINLKNPDRVFPFYNPPGARGEDTFLSTCLNQRKVLRVPCYAFHDGFSTYQHLMDGVLPSKLNHIEANSGQIVERFYKACIGWVRYKPLYLYITQREDYENKIFEVKKNLSLTLSKVSNYFGVEKFQNILKELEYYDKHVRRHYEQFYKTKVSWKQLIDSINFKNETLLASK
ncbi:MAG: hypothetical protein PHF63_04320 [Herbinix sp.]|nr:hypothetical protein [Herbinix sp.]